MLRLREDDVEYFDLKTLCKERQLGGRDSKDNLRAKLLRSVRQQLCLPVHGPDTINAVTVRLPQHMSEEELRQLFDSRGCMMPNSQWQALSMANALLIADGLLDPSQVMWPDAGVQWSSLTVSELKQECTARKLSSKGLKDELIERLKQWDAQTANEAALFASSEAAAAEAAAAEGAAPTATNKPLLQAAQELFASMHRMEIGQLREELSQRSLKAQGTKQILLAKLTEALEKDVARALGGERRLAQWAASAVGHMTEAELLVQLEARGVVQFSTSAEAAAALQIMMQKEWVSDALLGASAAAGPSSSASAGADWGMVPPGMADLDSGNGVATSIGASAEPYSLADESAAAGMVRQFVSGRAGDPTLAVALVCGGHSELQRDAALAAARVVAHYLQSDRNHGLLPRQQLEIGEGKERQGIAIYIWYAANGCHFPLTWEQLHSASAAELDARLALQASSATKPHATTASVDVVLPLGLSSGCPAMLAAADGIVVGSGSSEKAAKLAEDCLAFASRATELGFPIVPATWLQLSDFGDAAGVPRLEEMAAYTKVEAWSAQHMGTGSAPRLAVRAQVSESVLGGCLVNGPGDTLMAALSLMQEHAVGDVLLEAVHLGAHHFTCSVLATEQGIVALPPTGTSYYDIEEVIGNSELQLERFLAATEGRSLEGVDTPLPLLLEQQQAHPSYLGGPGSPSQQLHQSTPPTHLSAEAIQAIRQASTQLFKQLGLSDYAQFTGWVLPQRHGGSPAAPSASANGGTVLVDPFVQPRNTSFAELLVLDASAQAKAAAGSICGGEPGINPADRVGALDITAPPSSSDVGGKVASAGIAALESSFGMYNGISIDGNTRMTCDEALELGHPHSRPIPLEAPPEPFVQKLDELSSTDPQQLCQLKSCQLVAFGQLSLVPTVGIATSMLCQQAAAVGLTPEALLRHLVSAAALRAGCQPLPPLPEVVAAAKAQADEAGLAVLRGSEALGLVAPLDEQAVGAFLEEHPVPQWALPVQHQEQLHAGQLDVGSEGAVSSEMGPGGSASGFDVQDPYLDTFEQQQAAAAAWRDEVAAAGGTYSYTEIAAGEGYGEPAAVYLGSTAAEGVHCDAQDGQGTSLTGMHPTKQRVWVLFGGDGPHRTQSLQSGLHTFLSLRNNSELLVEAYMLEPSFAGCSEAERRQRLLDRRLDLLQMGMSEEWISQEQPHLDPQHIRHPPPSNSSIECHGLWRLTDSGLLRAEVEDLQLACETALASANASLFTLQERGGDLAAAQLSVARQELALAGVALDGSAWGGARSEELTPPQYLWMQDFVDRAREAGALVFLALSGQPAACGPLQRLLDGAGVPYTGSGHVAAETCADKPMLMEQLLDLEASGISTAPQQKISLPELSAQCDSEASAARLFDQLRASLGGGMSALYIKPSVSTSRLGAMRVTNGQDLSIYAKAVEAGADIIPGEALSDGVDVVMLMPPSSQFVVEPFVTTEPLQLLHAANGSVIHPESLNFPGMASEDELDQALHWPAGSNQWLQVSAIVMGAAGRMRCLGPTIRVLKLQETPTMPPPGSAAAALQRVQQLSEDAEAAHGEHSSAVWGAVQSNIGRGHFVVKGAFPITPPPPTLVLPEATSTARVRLEIVADRLGLSGAAEVSAYMHAETGEVVISDVSTLPDLGPGALIFRQAACDDSPLSPAEVFHELIRIGLTQPLEDREDLQAMYTSEAGEYEYQL